MLANNRPVITIAEVSARLRLLMSAFEDTPAEFARRIGMPSPQWTNYYQEGTNRRITPEAITFLVPLGVTSDWVYFGDESGLPKRLVDRLRMAELRGGPALPPTTPIPSKSQTVKRR